MDAKTGVVLREEHANVQRFPASLTKLMTLYVVFGKIKAGELRPKELIYFSKRACGACPTKLYLPVNDHMTVIDAILAIAVKSANDAAIALAEHAAGSEDAFVELMNEKAELLGMTKTVFRNVSGLPNREQVSTAHDLAILTKAILDHYPEYRHVFSTQYFLFRGKKYKNTNKLLGTMDGVDGMKTGYTPAAGFNLITSYYRGNDHLIGVVMGEKSGERRDLHMRYLLEGRKLSPQEIRRITTRTPEYFKEPTKSTQWGVQIGVFKDGRQAKRFGHKVKTSHAKILKNHAYKVVKKISNRVNLFKTRFNVPSQEKARAIADALKKRGVPCFVVNEP
jgi:D-alanyl-D-alanine carboxypeptidase